MSNFQFPQSALDPPNTDPTVLFEHFRGNHASELLTAAVCHFNVFQRLQQEPVRAQTLQHELMLEDRPAVVLLTALKAMGLLKEEQGALVLTALAEEHLTGGVFDCGDYIGLAAESPGVLNMVRLLRENRPMGADAHDGDGVAFIFRDGIRSAMDAAASARHFTLALAGRAKNVAPALAKAIDLSACVPDGESDSPKLLDVGGGTGIYSYALLQKHPDWQAVIFDHPEVLKLAKEFAVAYGVADRCQFVPGDMFADPLPPADALLLSNILHDWDVPECRQLLQRCHDALPTGGRVFIHDVFLNDALDGPLPIALYSASLFSFTEGRAYSVAEYHAMLETANLAPEPVMPTLVHCGVLPALKQA